jgi:hypothetical protein
MKLGVVLRGLATAVVIGVIQGCAHQPPAPLTDVDFATLMDKTGVQTDDLIKSGKTDDAIGMLNKVAQENPARKEPWLKKAKIYFDAGDYGNAIVASEEVLQRDKTDQTAKGIRAVSGLRVATQSLNDLRGDNNLKGSARADALSLVKTLRETLGEDVLVPPVPKASITDNALEAKPEEETPPPPASPKKHTRTHKATPHRSTPHAAPATQPQVNGDPFSVLR